MSNHVILLLLVESASLQLDSELISGDESYRVISSYEEHVLRKELKDLPQLMYEALVVCSTEIPSFVYT